MFVTVLIKTITIMKHFINPKNNALAGILVMACFFLSTSLNAQDSKVGELSFESEVIDYGEVALNSDGERTFKFTNTGDAPVVISKVKTTCGCTVADYPKTAILPGSSGEIKVKYATKKAGTFTKGITVLSNAKNATQSLKIKGTVLKGAS